MFAPLHMLSCTDNETCPGKPTGSKSVREIRSRDVLLNCRSAAQSSICLAEPSLYHPIPADLKCIKCLFLCATEIFGVVCYSAIVDWYRGIQWMSEYWTGSLQPPPLVQFRNASTQACTHPRQKTVEHPSERFLQMLIPGGIWMSFTGDPAVLTKMFTILQALASCMGSQFSFYCFILKNEWVIKDDHTIEESSNMKETQSNK